MAYIFGSIWDRFNRNALNDLSKSVEQQGKSIQDLVAEGQLTEEQYAQLITTINSLLKSGEIKEDDLSEDLRGALNVRFDKKANITQLQTVDDKVSTAKSAAESAEDKAESLESQLNSIVANDGTSNNEVVGARTDAMGSSKASLSQRLQADYERLDDNKANKENVRFNGILSGDEPNFFVDFENEKIVTNSYGTGLYKGADYYNLGEGEYSFADATGSTNFIVYDTQLGGIIFTTNHEANNLDKSRYAVFGVLRNHTHPEVFINGVGYRTSINTDSIKYNYNAALFTSSEYINIDTRNKKIITIENTGGGSSVVVNEKIHHLKSGEYDYSVGTISKFIAFDTETREIVFLTRAQLSTVSRTRYGVFGQVRSNIDHFDLQGTSYKIDGRIPSEKNIINDTLGDAFHITGDTGESYDPESTPITFNDNTKSADVYAAYDSLMQQYPNYISKTQLTTTPNGNEVSLYEFNTRDIRTHSITTQEKRKIFINGGIHGHEDDSIMGLLKFITDLCDDWKNQDGLMTIRANVHLMVVPLLNPDGFDIRGTDNVMARYNANSVDLNRNFPEGWDEGTDPMKGPSAASEVETQAVVSLLEDNPDISTVIDFHNYVDFIEYALWLGGNNQNVQEFLKSYARFADSRMVRKRSDLFENHPYKLVLIQPSEASTGLVKYAESRYQNGMILEVPQNIKNESVDYVQNFNADMVGNLLLNAVRQHKKLPMNLNLIE